MPENLPSDGVYEEIETIFPGEKDEGLGESGHPVWEEEYDDAGEPVPEEDEDMEEAEEEEGEEEEEESVLNSVGAHFCALLAIVLFLLYCSYSHCSALVSSYI